MSKEKTVTYSREGSVATVTLHRPDQLNSFNKELRFDLVDAMQRAADDDQARVVLFTGAGRAFSAGADLKAGMPPEGQTVEQMLQDEYRPSLELIGSMAKPVIAVLNGPVAGIAFGYAMHCDLAIMADHAYFLSPFTTISLVGDGGINWQLTRRLGYKRAYQLSVESEKIDAAMALSVGLVNKVVPADQLMNEAHTWAEALAQRAPLSLAATKKVMRISMQNTWEASFDAEASTQLDLLGSADNLEGVSAFLEKRKATFTGK